MKLQKTIIFISFMLGFCSLYAGNHIVPQQFINHSDWNFVENKGQIPLPPLKKGESASNNRVAYYGHQGGVYLYCQPGKISFVFTKVEKGTNDQISESLGRRESPFTKGAGGFDRSKHQIPESSKTTVNRADLILLNSNPFSRIIASDQQEYYENFYTTGNADSGITNVHTYKTITYKSIYPNIDLVLRAKPKGMKYEFVVYPGGNVDDIQMQWNGLDGIKKLKDSKIEYSCSLGKMTESKPVSFQGDNIVKSDFNKSDNRIGFNVGRYDKTKILVIDPNLEWGTYFGGSDADDASSIATDDSGYVFITGLTFSTSGIATNGSYQSSARGNPPEDAFIACFDSNGKIKWATYYGGTQTFAFSIVIDNLGSLYITGITNCPSGIATSGAFQTAPFLNSGPSFLAKFTTNGYILWATYFGGSGFSTGTSATCAAIDNFGNIYITGFTSCTGNLATTGAYQTSPKGAINAFISKFSSSGKLLWASYYGGNAEDEAYSIALDYAGNIFITGCTRSSSGLATSAAYQTFLSGYQNAFLAKINNQGNLQWSTYFGGDGTDNGIRIAIDSLGGIYIVGSTTSAIGIATNGAFQTTLGGSTDAFFAKFSNNGFLIWSTYYGGSGYDEADGIALDKFGDLYIPGTTSSSTNIATAGAFQTSASGEISFLAEFNSDGKREWGTYFGDGSSGFVFSSNVAVDNYENVYLLGIANGNANVATKGAYQENWAGDDDVFIAKFNFKSIHDAGIYGYENPKPNMCPDSQFIVQLYNFGKSELDSVKIGYSINGKIQKNYSWIGKLSTDSSVDVNIGKYFFSQGIYTIKSWTSTPNGFKDSVPENDTSTIIVNVKPLPTANPGQSSYQICTGTHIKIGANPKPGIAYLWTSDPPGFTSTLANPLVHPLNNTVYQLSVTDTFTGCTNTNSANVFVSIAQAPLIDVGKNQVVCAGISAHIGSPALTGDTYTWTSNPPGFTSTLAELSVTPNKTTSYSLTVTNTAGCTNFDSVIITLNPSPVPIAGKPQNICAGTVIQLGESSKPGHTYDWSSKPSGFSSSISDPIDSPKITTTYYLKETISATGCAGFDSVLISVAPLPDVQFNVKNINGYEYQFIVKKPNEWYWQYHWEFGDSASGKSDTASGFNVSHTYSQNAKYKVVLTVSLPAFCTETNTYQVDINEQFSLNIFPNPFATKTDINYTLVNPAHVKISLVDELGQQLGVLVDKQLDRGEYNTYYDAGFWTTRPAMYFVIFQLDDKVIVKKIIQLDSIYH